MQIKTALTLGTGVAIGIFIGSGFPEEKKVRILNCVKKKLIFALTREKWEPKADEKPKPVTFRSYYNTNTESTYFKPVPDENLLIFENVKEANDFLDHFRKSIEAYGSFTVTDLADFRNRTGEFDRTWDECGWDNATIGKVYEIPEDPLHREKRWGVDLGMAKGLF